MFLNEQHVMSEVKQLMVILKDTIASLKLYFSWYSWESARRECSQYMVDNIFLRTSSVTCLWSCADLVIDSVGGYQLDKSAQVNTCNCWTGFTLPVMNLNPNRSSPVTIYASRGGIIFYPWFSNLQAWFLQKCTFNMQYMCQLVSVFWEILSQQASDPFHRAPSTAKFQTHF